MSRAARSSFRRDFRLRTAAANWCPRISCRPTKKPDEAYPFVLTTGRQLEHWHTGQMTRRASVLDALEPEAICEMAPNDLHRLGLEPGDMVRLQSRRGAIETHVRMAGRVPEGVVFVPFCFAEAAANLLTNPALDPFGKIPELKYCAVKVERVHDAGGSSPSR